ncbi:hypothetical protein R6Q59_003741 [Mikania micrantha]
MEVFQSTRSNKQIFHRNVMLFLQNLGYNAAICKTKWESSGGLTSGNYEFIDVVRSDSGTRYFIDGNFSGEFDIARETKHFRRIRQHLSRHGGKTASCRTSGSVRPLPLPPSSATA